MQLDNHTTTPDARPLTATWPKGATEPEPVASRPVSLVNLLTELLQGYRRPAVVTTEQGAIVCMNAAAMRSIDRKPGEENDGIPADPKEWPRRAAVQAEGQVYYLAVPNQALESTTNTPEPQLPPRLAKIEVSASMFAATSSFASRWTFACSSSAARSSLVPGSALCGRWART